MKKKNILIKSLSTFLLLALTSSVATPYAIAHETSQTNSELYKPPSCNCSNEEWAKLKKSQENIMLSKNVNFEEEFIKEYEALKKRNLIGKTTTNQKDTNKSGLSFDIGGEIGNSLVDHLCDHGVDDLLNMIFGEDDGDDNQALYERLDKIISQLDEINNTLKAILNGSKNKMIQTE